MAGSLISKYFPNPRETDTFIMNGGIRHGLASKLPTHKGSDAANLTSGSSMDDPDSPSDPAQIRFLSNFDSQRSPRMCFRRWSRKEKYLMMFSFFLFLLCAIFIIVALTKDTQLKNLIRRNRTKGICLSKACVTTAAQLMAAMDFKADPCEDFFQFACGQWNQKHMIPEDKSSFTTFDKLYDELQIIMRALLEESKTSTDSQATMKAKTLYKSCMNVSQIEEMGDIPLRAVLNDLGGWPVIDAHWSSQQFILEDVLAKLRARFTSALLFDCTVGADDKNSSVNILQMEQGTLGMPSREYYFLKDHASHMQAYSRFMRDVVKLFGAEGPDVQAQLDNILEFEIKLANITLPSEDIQDTGALYNKLKVREIQQLFPKFDLLRYLRGLVLSGITEEEPIVLFATKYLQNLASILQSTDTRTVANYLMWRLVMEMIPELSEQYQLAVAQYRQAIQGVNKDSVRWKKCVRFVNDKMGMAVGAMFVRDNFKKESKDTAMEMIHNIREAFNELLEENDWMDGQTKSFAKEKANAMTERIGYPDYITDPVQLDSKYRMLNIQDDMFFNNNLELHEFAVRKMMDKLREPVRHDIWEQDPVLVNAFYNPNTNNILFPAGILQPLFYSSVFPKSLNYGGIGVVIGHEITHGFDDKGRQYDKNGNIKQWWDDHTVQAFRERAQCIIDQYSQYKLEQINEYMNGKITQGENIADNGGLKQAYRPMKDFQLMLYENGRENPKSLKAYRKWVEKNGEEPDLPGIGLTHNQLFFLNYAQIWCGKMRDEEAWRKIRTSVHSLGPLRVFGPLSNSHDFSRAYNCPLGSRMNPKHKCSVW